MKDYIKKELRKIEEKKGIKILHACETGSRAWGFPSLDSDYDVRMIYVHPTDWYLSLSESKDSIEMMLDDGNLDITGWELRKALRLMYKSNSSLMERIQSPITYISDDAFLAEINKLAQDCFAPIAAVHHYLSMTKKAFEDISTAETYKLKRLFYALRGALACKWVLDKNEIVPIVFTDMLMELEVDVAFRNRILELIKLKSSVGEQYVHEGEEDIFTFIKATIAEVSERFDSLAGRRSRSADLDSFFRSTLTSVWK